MKSALVFLWLLLVVLLPVSAGLFKVWVYQDAVQLGYRLSEREQNLRKLTNDLRQLEIELAAERSPARLQQLAKSRDLIPPMSQQVLGPGRFERGAHGQP